MRDLGLESLGAQLSLLGRQITSSINAVLPEELALFGCGAGACLGSWGGQGEWWAVASPPGAAVPVMRPCNLLVVPTHCFSLPPLIPHQPSRYDEEELEEEEARAAAK